MATQSEKSAAAEVVKAFIKCLEEVYLELSAK